MFDFIKKIFIGFLTSILNASNHTKRVSLSNQKFTTQPIIDLHPNKYNRGLRYYPFVINLYWCAENCNTLNDLSNKICIRNKTEDLNLSVFIMITGINESKILTKHTSCKCKFKLDCKKSNSNQNWNKDKCWCEYKNPKKHRVCEKDHNWNPA